MFLGGEDQPVEETGQVCSFVRWVSHAGNREGLRKIGSCLGIGGMLLKFEQKCRWTEQRAKMSRNWPEGNIHMVTGAAWRFDGLSGRQKAHCRKQLRPQIQLDSQGSRWKIPGLISLVLIPHRVV